MGKTQLKITQFKTFVPWFICCLTKPNALISLFTTQGKNIIVMKCIKIKSQTQPPKKTFDNL